MAKSRLFDYVVLLHPIEKKDEETTEQTQIIVPAASVLATTQDQAAMVAARSIPEEHMDKLNRIEVCIRPF